MSLVNDASGRSVCAICGTLQVIKNDNQPCVKCGPRVEMTPGILAKWASDNDKMIEWVLAQVVGKQPPSSVPGATYYEVLKRAAVLSARLKLYMEMEMTSEGDGAQGPGFGPVTPLGQEDDIEYDDDDVDDDDDGSFVG